MVDFPYQRVAVGSFVGQALGFLLLLRGDVRVGDDVVGDDAMFVFDGRAGQPLREDLAVLAPVPDLIAPDTLFLRRAPGVLVEAVRVASRAHETGGAA